MDTKRLFVSIEVPPGIGQILSDLNPNLPGVRWLEPKQMHLTLSFLGSVSLDQEQTLKATLIEVAWKPFFLPMVGLGKFPSKGPPAVIWIGVGTGHPHLFQLHKRVQEAALKSGIEPDLRQFRPHVTVARCKNASEHSARTFIRSQPEFDAGMIHVERFCLYSSRLASSGSDYTLELACPPHD